MASGKRIILFSILMLFISFSKCIAKPTILLEADKYRLKKDEEISINISINDTAISALTLEIYFDTNKLKPVDLPENSNYINNKIIYTWVESLGKENESLEIEPFNFKVIAQSGIVNIVATGEFYNSNGDKINIENSNIELEIGEENKQLEEQHTVSSQDVGTDNTNLRIMRLNHEGITPEFSKGIKEYYFIADETINNLEVTAIPENQNSRVTITGNQNLKMGLNTINIQVESEDNTKKSNYKIYITKTSNKELANANLENLAVREGTIAPEFNSNITKYRVEVPYNIDNIYVLAVPQNINANVQMDKTNNLRIGDNIIEIMVVANDGITKKKYEILAHRRNQQEEIENQEEEEKQVEQLNTILIEKQNEENEQQQIQNKNHTNKYIIGIIIILITITTLAIWFVKRKNKYKGQI